MVLLIAKKLTIENFLNANSNYKLFFYKEKLIIKYFLSTFQKTI